MKTSSIPPHVRGAAGTGAFSRAPPRWGRLALLALVVSTASPATAGELDSLLEDLNSIRHDYRVPGIALTLVSGESVLWSGGIGYADVDNRKPATPDTTYPIQALSGTLAGLAVLLAAERGELSLDDRLQTAVPDAPLDNPWEQTHPVRIAHLLEHTAGLLDTPAREPPRAQDAFEGPSGGPERRRCYWPPGLFPSWSRIGVTFAIAALEHSTGAPYAAFLERQLFGPLDMWQTRVVANAASPEDSDRPVEALEPAVYGEGTPSGAPTLISTPRELAALLQLLLNRGMIEGRRLVSEASIERLATPRTPLAAHQGLRFGFGAGNVPSIYRGFLFHGQSSDTGAHLSDYAYSHQLQLGYVVIINAPRPAALERLRRRIQDYMIADHRPHRPPVADVDPQQLARFGGQYQALTWRFAAPLAAQAGPPLQVLLIDGQIHIRRAGGQRQALLPVTGQLFRYAEQPLATIAFVEYGDDIYLLGPFGNYRRIAATASGGTQR
jgi:CubicO group peptidase (beta-lactamase class C family)